MDSLRQRALRGSVSEPGDKETMGLTEKKTGDSYLVRGEFNEAVDWFSKALEKNPENETYWTARSEALLKMHCCREALLDARTAVQLAPDWHEGYYQLGLAFQEMSMLGYAQTAFQNAQRMSPSFEEATRALATIDKILAERFTQQQKMVASPLSLCQCVYAGDFSAVRDYMTSGKVLSPEFVTLPHRELYMTPMQVALLNQYFDIAQFLLDHDILFPENVCDWMVAQVVAERKARMEVEEEGRGLRQEVIELRAELHSARLQATTVQSDHADARKRQQEQVAELNTALKEAHRKYEAGKATISRLERQLAEMERGAQELRASEDRLGAERGELLGKVEELRARLLDDGGLVEERLQAVAWRPQASASTSDVELVEVSAATDPAAHQSDLTKCMQHCHRAQATFQQALSHMMRARQGETAGRAGLKESLALAERQAAWPLPVAAPLSLWHPLQVDLDQEEKRAQASSTTALQAVVQRLHQLQGRPDWASFRDLLTDLHAQAQQIQRLLEGGRLDDAGFAAVLGAVVADLERAVREDPIAVHLLSLADKEKDVKAAAPQLQEQWLSLQATDLRAAEVPYRKQLEIMDGLLHYIGLKLDAMRAEHTQELTKLSALVVQASDTIAKLKATFAALSGRADVDLQALQAALKRHQEEGPEKEAAAKRDAFTTALQETELQQETLWGAVIQSLAQISKLQEKRTTTVQKRLAEMWGLKRKQKVQTSLAQTAADTVHQLKAVQQRCQQAEGATTVLARLVSAYSGHLGQFLSESQRRLREAAPELHNMFFQWFTAWVKGQAALLQMKRGRVSRLAVTPGADEERRALEAEVAKMGAALEAKLHEFDAPGHTGEFLKQQGLPFTHPLLVAYPSAPTDPTPRPAPMTPMQPPPFMAPVPYDTVPLAQDIQAMQASYAHTSTSMPNSLAPTPVPVSPPPGAWPPYSAPYPPALYSGQHSPVPEPAYSVPVPTAPSPAPYQYYAPPPVWQ